MFAQDNHNQGERARTSSGFALSTSVQYEALDAEATVSKPNYLLEHFRDPRQRDQVSPIILASDDPERLRFLYLGHKGDWNTVARFISDRERWPVAWIPDANVAFLDAMMPVWNALRVVALGKPMTRRSSLAWSKRR